eukprot:scaffold982_cov139-Cylindrotheca_fusiformis.AAC.5
MATPYSEGETAQWQDPSNDRDATNFRSVTPAMNNIRRNASPAPLGRLEESGREDSFAEEKKEGPSSTGLIRLALRKPMGIVFEPMYDPSAPSVQRGVRVCDLPRTGAAALSRKLEVGDELLSINDKTMSRLTFDEIMDFIIEADPESVSLLFRRPRKEVLHARHGIKAPSGGPGVKWVDDGDGKIDKPKKSSRKDKKPPRRPARRDDDETLQTEDESYQPRRSRRGRRRHNPYESESFLDILIDTICANPDSVCRDRRRMGDDDTYYSEDEETFASRDDSTFVTQESEPSRRKRARRKGMPTKKPGRIDDYSNATEDDETREEKRPISKPARSELPTRGRVSPVEEEQPDPPAADKKYEDDGTLETVDSQERAKALQMEPKKEPVPPLGLAPNPEPTRGNLPSAQIDEDEQTNPAAPIKAVEFDEDADVGADVSVMDSLGGPSLLVEKQRQAQVSAAAKQESTPPVPREIADNFGSDYPLDFGFTREQTIQNDPLRFYSYVVRGLLQEHEPEKVRLLDKLLAKYKGREDHLVQKLSVRYNTTDDPEEEENQQQQQPNGFDQEAKFEEAVARAKESAHSRENIETARERMHSRENSESSRERMHARENIEIAGERTHSRENTESSRDRSHSFGHNTNEWPEKETKEPEPVDVDYEEEEDRPMDEEDAENMSQYSDELDGTSPAVIAQVSELLNYVYGKTTVPGQIDRVSTIMRAYEGREAVLLELLETKALIKANRDKENAGNLPSFLRNSRAQESVQDEVGDLPAVTPMAIQSQPVMHDEVSSMSGISTPAPPAQQKVLKPHSSPSETPKKVQQSMSGNPSLESNHYDGFASSSRSPRSMSQPKPRSPSVSADNMQKKKKKGIFGGLFKKGKKDGKARSSSNGRSLRTQPRTFKTTEASI